MSRDKVSQSNCIYCLVVDRGFGLIIIATNVWISNVEIIIRCSKYTFYLTKCNVPLQSKLNLTIDWL